MSSSDPDPLVPHVLLANIGPASRVVEVGAGARFDVALLFAARGARVTVTDLDPRVLAAPSPLDARVADAAMEDAALFEGVDLVYAVRPPEELQPILARVARRFGCALALRPLGNEWVDLGEWLAEPERARGWLVYPRAARGRVDPDDKR